MKRFVISLVILLATVTGVNAMSYQQARDQALFLTDKMAYELNLNDQQYEAVYQINLDYLMSVSSVDDVYAVSWRQRNVDMGHVLLDWQYNTFCAASYFFRPLYWSAGNWHFGIYAHYPRHDFFYFSRPVCYTHYRGGHSWRNNGGVSWYGGRVEHFRPRGVTHVGMRDNYRPAGGRPSYTPGHHNTPDYGHRRPQGNVIQQRPARPGNRPTDSRPAQGNGTQQRPQMNGSQTNGGRPAYNRPSSTRSTPGSTSAAPYGGGNSRGRSGSRSFTPSNRGTHSVAPQPVRTSAPVRADRR